MNYYDFSKYRKQLMGISTLMVLWLHFFELFNSNIQKVAVLGSAGVDIFIVLSGIGCYYSISNSTIYTFYKNRLYRVVIPYLVIAIPIRFLIDYKTAWQHVFLYDFFINGDDRTWFVLFILVFYLVFPLLYKIKNKREIILYFLLCASIVTLIFIDFFFYEMFSKYAIALGRIPIAIFSVLIADKVMNKNKISCALIIGSSFLTVFKYYPFRFENSIIFQFTLVSARSFICMLVMVWILSYILKFRFFDTVLCFFGKYSFEVYILHVLLGQLLDKYFNRSQIINFIVSVLISIVFSPIIKNIIEKVKAKFENKEKFLNHI